MKHWTRVWDDFWFKPIPATAMAVYRILFGLIVLHCNALMAPELLMWFGVRGVVSLEFWRQAHLAPCLSVFHALPARDEWVIAFFLIYMIATFALTVGLFTRISAVIVWLGLTSFYGRNPFIHSGSDILMNVNAFWLIFSQAGAALSLDSWRRRGKAPERPPWGQRMIQCQSALMYFSTSLWKMLGGRSWWDGTAVYYGLRWYGLERFPIPPLIDHVWSYRLMSWATLLIETSLWTLIWIPRLRYWVLAGGTALHLGIGWSLNIPPFQALAIAGYITFVRPEDLSRWGANIRGWLGSRLRRISVR